MDPTGNTLTIRTGTGDNVREHQLSINNQTRFWDANRRIFTDGLRNNAFRAGTDIWYRAGTGNAATMINDLRFYDPAVTAPGGAGTRINPMPPGGAGTRIDPMPPGGANVQGGAFIRGQIVSIDPTNNMLTVRTGTGTNVQEQQFRINNDTRFFGPNRAAFQGGLTNEAFRTGANIWFRAGTGDNANTINDLRFFDPTANAPGLNRDNQPPRNNDRDR